ncbi:MAG: iron-containing alcohol dehydrogenase [Planctomycetes bacterium]|nr:iron-containing alcohol dehydrogenase [Planctomycetota bacterium]
MPLDIADYSSVLRHSRVRVVFGDGTLRKLGALAVDEGATRVLLVTDPGIVRAGHAQRAMDSLREAGVEVTLFDGACENPTTREVDAGLHIARELGIDFLVGLGGGSSMDCAKGINFLLTNGGEMMDYWGVNKATQPMLPLICVPTTAGTGSEAQSFALITDPDTHQKMACGDEKALPRVAILDPELIATVPHGVAAATGIDAVAHAIETAGCKKRTAVSRELSVAAWGLLEPAFEKIISEAERSTPSPSKGEGRGEGDERRMNLSNSEPTMARARASMLLGAHLAGAAIEKSMLGAAHACANPLTARFNITHGISVGLMLPHVIRFNAAVGENPYHDLADAKNLARRVEFMLAAAKLPRCLSDVSVSRNSIAALADMAAEQWTAKFNPRHVESADMQRLYELALE